MERDKDFWTRKNRVTRVTRTEIQEFPKSLFPKSPPALLEEAIARGDTIWELVVYYRTGFDEEDTSRSLHPTKAEAEADMANYPVGSEIEPMEFLHPESSEFDPEKLSIATEISIWGRGEVPYFTIYRALEGAGVIDSRYQTSDRVLSWVGSTGKEALASRFGENWEAVALLEYCVKHFSPTSLATLAARAMVADFIADSDFDAGYASRELEMLLGGAEDIAAKSESARKKAGEKGAQASHARRLRNLNVLLKEIEALSSVVGLMSEERIVDQAFESVREKYSDFPKSSKTRFDYETTLRSEEPFKSRYEAVFRGSA